MLLPGVGSLVGEDAVAVALRLATCPEETAATMLTERTPAGAVPAAQVQMTGLTALQLPPALGEAETKLVPAGRGKVMVAPCASEGPALLSVAM